MEDTDARQTPTPASQPPKSGRWTRLINEIERQLHERKSKKEAENPVDRAARLTAKATIWIAAFTVVMALVGIGTLYEIIEGGGDTHHLAIAARDAAKAAQRSADSAVANVRPWIKINSVELRPDAADIKTLMFHWPPSGLQFFSQLAGKELPPILQVKVLMTNVGHTPAENVEVEAELFFHKFSPSGWHDAIKSEEVRFCKSQAKRLAGSGSQIAFPSDPLENDMGLSGTAKSEDITIENGIRYSSTAALFCVNYESAGLRYQTQAWFGLYRDNYIKIPIGADTSFNHLRLIREANGDHAE